MAVLVDHFGIFWSIRVWIRHDDTPTVFELEVKECRTLTLACVVLQVPQYLH